MTKQCSASGAKVAVVLFTTILLFFIVGTSRVATAQEATTQEPDKLMLLSASALVVLPQSDADNVTETSLGLRTAFAYRVHPWIFVVGAFEYVFANEKEDVVGDTNINYYSIGFGGRLVSPKKAKLKGFGELLIGRHTLTVDGDADSDLGFRLGGGGLYEIGPNLTLIGQVSYSSVEIERADIDALILEFGIGMSF